MRLVPSARLAIRTAFCVLLVTAALCSVAAAREVRVALMHMPPGVFQDKDGKPQGLAVDILEETARAEGWTLTWVPGSLAEGLERLAAGQVDLLPWLTASQDRSFYLDFSRRKYLRTWGAVYTRKDLAAASLLDLDRHTVALERGSRAAQGYLEMIADYGLTAVPVWEDSPEAVLQAVAQGRADAGAVPRLFGDWAATNPDVEPTNITLDRKSVV